MENHVVYFFILRGNLGVQGRGGGAGNASPLFFLPNNKFLATELKRGK
jgi:hypothetical protein